MASKGKGPLKVNKTAKFSVLDVAGLKVDT